VLDEQHGPGHHVVNLEGWSGTASAPKVIAAPTIHLPRRSQGPQSGLRTVFALPVWQKEHVSVTPQPAS